MCGILHSKFLATLFIELSIGVWVGRQNFHVVVVNF